MNNTLCPRCGFPAGNREIPTEIKGMPEGVSYPPLPDEAQPHPHGVCCSPFEIGDMLWWDLEGAALDLPPMKVFFKSLVGIASPDFTLIDGKWHLEGARQAQVVKVRPVRSSLQPCHDVFYDDPDQEFEVSVKSLTAVDRWPVMEIA